MPDAAPATAPTVPVITPTVLAVTDTPVIVAPAVTTSDALEPMTCPAALTTSTAYVPV
jgi:hypothetical protein